jgi:hypothetical protein
MPDPDARQSDLRERATKVEIRLGDEVFGRPVRKIVIDGAPRKETDGSVKDVRAIVTYDDGTEDTFYFVMSARRPLTVPES